MAHRDRLQATLEEVLGRLSRAPIEARLRAAAIAYASVNDVAQAVGHPQLVQRGRRRPIGTPGGRGGGDPSAVGGRTRAGDGRRTDVGEHTLTVLRGLGYGPAEIEKLQRAGVIQRTLRVGQAGQPLIRL